MILFQIENDLSFSQNFFKAVSLPWYARNLLFSETETSFGVTDSNQFLIHKLLMKKENIG